MLKSKSIDSSKHQITFNIYTGAPSSFDEYIRRTHTFTENRLVSYSLYYNRKLKTIKDFSFSILVGLNYKTIKVGYNAKSKLLPATTQSFSASNHSMSLNIGLMIEKPIVRFKKMQIVAGFGGYLSGQFYSPKKYKSFSFASDYSSNTDDYSFYFHNNRDIYPYSFLQLKLSQQLKKRHLIYGLRYLAGGKYFKKPPVVYDVFYYTDPNGNYVYSRGKFTDIIDKFEFFIGLQF
ncbi:MAG: hypothetical protein V4613_08975 [Bacteroidota bacterium]